MQAVFYGVGAAVIGIVAMSAKKLTAKSIDKDKLLWAIYLLLAAVTAVTESEISWLFIAAGVLVWLLRAPPAWLRQRGVPAVLLLPELPATLGSIDLSLLGQIGIFFAEAGAFVFGSGLAIVPFLYGGVVTEHHWLSDKQFVDAVAVAMITPGPVVITVGFIGYLIAGLSGATVAALATFVPCYLFTVLPAPYFKKYGKLPGVLAFVDGITAAAIGAITGSVFVIAKRSIVDIPTALIAVTTVVLLWKFKKLQEPLVVGGAAVLGLLDAGALRRYAGAYSALREYPDSMNLQLMFLSGPRFADLMADLRIHEVKPRELLRVLTQLSVTQSLIENNLATLEKNVAEALLKEAGAAAH